MTFILPASRTHSLDLCEPSARSMRERKLRPSENFGLERAQVLTTNSSASGPIDFGFL